MRKGFLWTICTLLAVAGSVRAQAWPWYPTAAARPNYPPAYPPGAGPAPQMQPGQPYYPGSMGWPAAAPANYSSYPGGPVGPTIVPPTPPASLYWQANQVPGAVMAPAGSGAAGMVQGAGAAEVEKIHPPKSPGVPTKDHETASEGMPVAGCDTPVIVDGDEDHYHPESCSTCSNGRFWVNADYLVWWLKNQSVPVPLVTTGTPLSLGILGLPGTVPLFNDSNFAYGYQSGGRLDTGFWFDPQQSAGIEATGFLLERARDTFKVSSNPNGTPLLASPFINSLTGQESASFISLPGQNAGGFLASSSIGIWGAEGDFVLGLYRNGPVRSDFLAGFRYMDMIENLDIFRSTSLFPGVSVPFGGAFVDAPATINITDAFDTRNRFFGGTLAYRYEVCWDRFCLGMMVKGSLGTTQQIVNIQGFSKAQPDTSASTEVPGGLLALTSNIGQVTKYRLTGVPEGEFKIGYHIHRNVLLSLGYNFIYWSSVVRPADQISRTVNPTNLPTSVAFGAPFALPQPTLVLHQTDFWMQGISAGVAIIF